MQEIKNTMKVWEARIVGFILGIPISWWLSSSLLEQIKFIYLIIGVTFVLFGWRITGVTGGIIQGFGIGLSCGVFIPPIIVE